MKKSESSCACWNEPSHKNFKGVTSTEAGHLRVPEVFLELFTFIIVHFSKSNLGIPLQCTVASNPTSQLKLTDFFSSGVWTYTKIQVQNKPCYLICFTVPQNPLEMHFPHTGRGHELQAGDHHRRTQHNKQTWKFLLQ